MPDRTPRDRVMPRIRRGLARCLATVRPAARDRDLARELASHLALLEDDYVRSGMPREQAALAARRQFSGITQTAERHRDARSLRWLSDLVQDLRYSVRSLRRSPGFAITAACSLALGIGANAVLFSVLDTLVLRTAPVPSPDQVVNISETLPGGRSRTELPVWQFARLRSGLSGVMTIAAVAVFDRSNVSAGASGGAADGTGRARIAVVSGDYFPMLQVPAAIGRTLTPADDLVPDGHPVALISDAFWARSFQRDADVLARSVTVNESRFAVVGVMPRGFTGDWVGRPVDIWVPSMMQARVMIEAPDALTNPNAYWLRLVARLDPGVALSEARERARTVHQQMLHDPAPAGAHPLSADVAAQQRLVLGPGAHGFSPQRDALRDSVLTLGVAAGLVLLVVCANVAGLTLSRAMSRQREFAVRLAIGAGTGRLARQLLAEGLLIATAGGGLGLLIAMWGANALSISLGTAPVQMFWASTSQISFDAQLSTRGVAVTVLLSVVTGLAVALAPALRQARLSLAPALSARNAATTGTPRRPIGKVLVAAQVGLSLVVFVGAGLLARSLSNLESHDLGFSRDNLLLVWTQPSSTGRSGSELKVLWRDLQGRLATVPGVRAASGSNAPILDGYVPVPGAAGVRMHIDGEPPRPTSAAGGRTFVMPDFFATLGVPIVAGTEITDADASKPVVVINETMARFYFGGRNPIGQRVGFGSATRYEIVGVVRDFERGTPRAAGREQMTTYFPYGESTGSQLVVLCLVLRTHGDPRTLASSVRDAIRATDPTLAILKIDTLEEQLNDVLAQDRLTAALAAFFGGIGVLLSCLGLYGLIAQSVSRRTSEIGIRMALGATRVDVLSMILREALGTVLAGMAVGIPMSLAAARLVAPRLFGVHAADPATTTAAVVVMVAVALAGAVLPARRAAAIEPIAALREG